MIMRRLVGLLFIALAALLVLSMLHAGITDYTLPAVGFGCVGAYLAWSARWRAAELRALPPRDPSARGYSLRAANLLVAAAVFMLPVFLLTGNPEGQAYLGVLLLPFSALSLVTSFCLSFRALEEGMRSPAQYAIAAVALAALLSPFVLAVVLQDSR
jgi:hypothetical protein